MKKNLIIALALVFASKFAIAQTEKGTQTLGINLTVTGENLTGTALNDNDNGLAPTTTKTNQLDIGPTYSYFIADKLDIGADLSYAHYYIYETPNYTPYKQVQNMYSGDIFLRKYFMCTDKFGFRAGPYLGYGKADYSYNYTTYYAGNLTNSSTQTFYGGISLDLVYYPAKHLGVSVALANAEYYHNKQNNDDNGNNTSNNYVLALITEDTGISVFYTF